MGNVVRKLTTAILIFLILNSSFLVLSTPKNYSTRLNLASRLQKDQLISREKIQIQDNSNFQGFPGSGTKEDPYIISGFDITAPESEDYNLIDIQDTDVFFIIENNYLSGNNLNNGYGILLSGVINGLIRNNEIYNTTHGGLFIQYSQDVVVENNLIADHQWAGLELFETNNIEIRNNIFNNNNAEGIASYFSTENIILNNTLSFNIYNGITIEFSDSHQISGNKIFSNGLGGILLASAESNLIEFNVISDNPTGINLINLELNGPAKDNVVVSNLINLNGEGILLEDGEDNSISQNLIDENQYDGIVMINGRRNVISNNIISRTIELQGFVSTGASSDNIINCNLFSENNIYGVFIDANSENELIKQNNFIDNFNIPQAHDSGISNSFENNYWNDQDYQDQNNDSINDNQYSIGGSTANVDFSPATNEHLVNDDLNICNLEEIGLPSEISISPAQTTLLTGVPLEPVLVLPIAEPFLLIFFGAASITIIISVFYLRKSNIHSNQE